MANCKQGDLAIVVRSECGNAGKIVQCLRLAMTSDVWPYDPQYDGPVWMVDTELNSLHIKTGKISKVKFVPDVLLRPLRDSGETDEVLIAVGKPVKEGV